MIGWEETVLRIVLGAVLGGLVGLEREMRGQAAGFRTHTLVSMGSTLFTLVSLYGIRGITGDGGEVLHAEPGRIAAQIVVGIGFLGAGAIIRHGTSVKGLTTAASLWVVAAMGLSVGAGFYVGAITVALMLLVVLRALRSTENLLVKWVYPDEATLTVRLDSTVIDSEAFIVELEKESIRVRDISALRSGKNALTQESYTIITLAIRLTRRAAATQQVVENIRDIQGVLEVKWER
ncbi:MAG: MgtC/SapB family protein [Thermoleophilia bacterium]|nr:MgtC/SapB family protein [Thermoleophilia bacterium]